MTYPVRVRVNTQNSHLAIFKRLKFPFVNIQNTRDSDCPMSELSCIFLMKIFSISIILRKRYSVFPKVLCSIVLYPKRPIFLFLLDNTLYVQYPNCSVIPAPVFAPSLCVLSKWDRPLGKPHKDMDKFVHNTCGQAIPVHGVQFLARHWSHGNLSIRTVEGWISSII